MSTVRREAATRAAFCAAVNLACLLQAAGATSDPPVANPLGGGQGVTLEPAPPPAAPRRHRAVYVCREDGVPVYTDRPCGSGASVRGLVVETPRPGVPASTAPPVPRASTRPRPVPARPESRAAPDVETRCGSLQRQVDELNDRMRAGYSAREAARLWQRWRDAKERLRQARC
jgi:hypothetical protein